MKKRLMVAVAVLVWTGTVLAQQGSLAGKVEDDSGQPLAGANVAVKGKGAPDGRGASADGAGKYQLLELPPGTYEATAPLPGKWRW